MQPMPQVLLSLRQPGRAFKEKASGPSEDHAARRNQNSEEGKREGKDADGDQEEVDVATSATAGYSRGRGISLWRVRESL